MVFDNPEFRALFLEGMTKVSIAVVTNITDNLLSPKHPVSPSDTTPKPSSPCITCSIYQEVTQARSYILDLLDHLNPDGSIPAGLGGTLKNAQEHVEIAQAQIVKVMGINPRIDAACMQLAKLLPEIQARLNFVSSKTELEAIAVLARESGTWAYSIPETMYRRDGAIELEAQGHALDRILDPEELDIIKQLKSLKDPKLSPEERRAKLAAFIGLEEEESNGA